MAIFPSNPSIGDKYTTGGREHTYDGKGWYYSGGRSLTDINDGFFSPATDKDLLYYKTGAGTWFDYTDPRSNPFTVSPLSTGLNMTTAIELPWGTAGLPTIDGRFNQWGAPGGVGFVAFGSYNGIDIATGKEYTDGIVIKIPKGFNTLWLKARFQSGTAYSYAFTVAYKETSTSAYEYIGMYKATKGTSEKISYSGMYPDGFVRNTLDQSSYTVEIPITHGKTNGGFLFIGNRGSLDGYPTPTSCFIAGYSFTSNAYNMSFTDCNTLFSPGYNFALAGMNSIGSSLTFQPDWNLKGRVFPPAGNTASFPVFYTKTGKDRMIVIETAHDSSIGYDAGVSASGFFVNDWLVPMSAIRTTKDWFTVGITATRTKTPSQRLIQIRVPRNRIELFDRAFKFTINDTGCVDLPYTLSGIYVYDIPYDSRNQW